MVDTQSNNLPGSIAKEAKGKPAIKARPKRVSRGDMKFRRVVITGIGAITPLGLTIDEYWQGLINGKSGIANTTLCDVSDLSCRISGEVKGFEPRNYMDHKEAIGESYEDIPKRVPDTGRIKEVIGWEAKIELEEGLKKMAQSYKS